MEQTNLVVSPDGKTWDEVTRDTSYIGNNCIMTTTDSGSTSASTTQIFDEWRGGIGTISNHPAYNKNFAISCDKFICLKDGVYHIHAQTIKAGSGGADSCKIYINGEWVLSGHQSTSDRDTSNATIINNLKRGDYIQLQGLWYGAVTYSQFFIQKVS